MTLFRSIYHTVLDALFPVSGAERELSLLTPETALLTLPGAPDYAGLTVPLTHVSSIFAYKDERVSRLIWGIKYKKDRQAVELGGYALWRTLIPLPTILIPMPITSRRRRERGFNQCELLADEIKRLDATGGLIIEKGLLVRAQHKSRQTMKDRQERLSSARGIFAVDEEVAVKLRNSPEHRNARLIVIDDVITTGSTMKEAVDTLRAAGFADVHGLSLAH